MYIQDFLYIGEHKIASMNPNRPYHVPERSGCGALSEKSVITRQLTLVPIIGRRSIIGRYQIKSLGKVAGMFLSFFLIKHSPAVTSSARRLRYSGVLKKRRKTDTKSFAPK